MTIRSSKRMGMVSNRGSESRAHSRVIIIIICVTHVLYILTTENDLNTNGGSIGLGLKNLPCPGTYRVKYTASAEFYRLGRSKTTPGASLWKSTTAFNKQALLWQ